MERPVRPVRWERRNGMYALVLWRVAVPEWFAMLLAGALALSAIALFCVGMAFSIWWMVLPLAIPAAGFILYYVWVLLRNVVDDFRRVNRKEL